jgi:hypothetical protein
MRLTLALLASALIAAPASATPSQQNGALPAAVASAGVTQDQWTAIRAEVTRQARRAGASEAALLAAAEAAGANLAGSGHFNALSLQQAIFEQLANQADQIAELQHRLDALIGDSDPAIARIYADARTALDEGRLTDADGLLAQASERDLAALQQADAEAERRRLRAGETIAARGQVAYIQDDYIGAAAFYARAAGAVPQSAIQQRLPYVSQQAYSLRRRGELFNDMGALHEAFRVYRDAALPLASRGERPDARASIQNDMGIALLRLGERGDDQALHDAVAAFRAALEVQTRTHDPANWARDQNNLGDALRVLGERGDNQALRDAAVALRAALEVNTRVRAPGDWAMAQNNLGNVLEILGERGDDQALRQAIAAFRAALEVDTPENDAEAWARDQNNLGNALEVLGERGDDAALFDAITAYRAALAAQTRERDPAHWAMDQEGLGIVLKIVGERGRGPNQGLDALHDAVVAFQGALEIETRESSPESWARAQASLGSALRVLGERGEGPDHGLDALHAAVAAYRAALEVTTRERDPLEWAGNQGDLANVLSALGWRGDGSAQGLDNLHDAVATLRSALEVFTRDQFPDDWARGEDALGATLTMLGGRGDGPNNGMDAFRQAVAEFHGALEVNTRQRNPAAWARHQYNLAIALGALAERGERARLPDALAAAHAAFDGYQQTANAPQMAQVQRMIAALQAMR